MLTPVASSPLVVLGVPTNARLYLDDKPDQAVLYYHKYIDFLPEPPPDRAEVEKEIDRIEKTKGDLAEPAFASGPDMPKVKADATANSRPSRNWPVSARVSITLIGNPRAVMSKILIGHDVTGDGSQASNDFHS